MTLKERRNNVKPGVKDVDLYLVLSYVTSQWGYEKYMIDDVITLQISYGILHKLTLYLGYIITSWNSHDMYSSSLLEASSFGT